MYLVVLRQNELFGSTDMNTNSQNNTITTFGVDILTIILFFHQSNNLIQLKADHLKKKKSSHTSRI